MFDRLEMFRLSGAMAEHARQRQTVAAANLAQADTPGYRAQAVASFAESVDHGAPGALAMRATRPGHATGGSEAGAARLFEASHPASPDGNTVSIEAEMAQAARARGEHDRALGVYRSGLTILRASLGRR